MKLLRKRDAWLAGSAAQAPPSELCPGESSGVHPPTPRRGFSSKAARCRVCSVLRFGYTCGGVEEGHAEERQSEVTLARFALGVNDQRIVLRCVFRTDLDGMLNPLLIPGGVDARLGKWGVQIELQFRLSLTHTFTNTLTHTHTHARAHTFYHSEVWKSRMCLSVKR